MFYSWWFWFLARLCVQYDSSTFLPQVSINIHVSFNNRLFSDVNKIIICSAKKQRLYDTLFNGSANHKNKQHINYDVKTILQLRALFWH